MKKNIVKEIRNKIKKKNQKKKNKIGEGFTLIELLAVIVILGLLMAIAIPSVTKYITESRKKTVVSTIGNYITAMINEVNDLTYTFTETNTIYAVPIECIALERGGSSPLGEWHQANDDYWAYVLIQYDEKNSSYIYGYTFKDSSGYGLYPTTQSKLNNSGKQIKTKLSLSRPKTGNITEITETNNWSGFIVDDTTKLVVLAAESEGNIGNGKTTCTLCQKGENYAAVEEEKEEIKKEEEEKIFAETDAYAIYSEADKTLTFVRSKNEIKPGDVYDGINVTNVYTGFEKVGWYDSWEDIRNDVEKVIFKDKVKPKSTAPWFQDFINCSYFDVTNLDTSNVTDMYGMFYGAGKETRTFEIKGMDKWDTSKVTSMNHTFREAGMYTTTFNIGDLSQWNTSNVEDMTYTFSDAGSNSTIFNIGNLSNWDTSKVTGMNSMFASAGSSAETFNIGDLSNWDTSNVTDMAWMFRFAGSSSTTFNIGNLSKWDTSKVNNMDSMFNGAGSYSTNWTIGNLSNWDTSNVTNMDSMFYDAGRETITFNIGDLSKWDTSNVTTMLAMFSCAGENSTIFNIGDLSNWDTSNVTDMAWMFRCAGFNSTTFKLVGIDNWDTSNVTSMNAMFESAGYNSTTFNIGDLSNWDTSNVTDMGYMFDSAGANSTTFNIGDLSNWKTLNVTNMSNMFYYAGYSASYSLDLSKWDVSQVIEYVDFGDASKVTPPNWKN